MKGLAPMRDTVVTKQRSSILAEVEKMTYVMDRRLDVRPIANLQRGRSWLVTKASLDLLEGTVSTTSNF